VLDADRDGKDGDGKDVDGDRDGNDGIGARIVTYARVVGCQLVAASPRLTQCGNNAGVVRIEQLTDNARNARNS
jgi:hypothetical protein